MYKIKGKSKTYWRPDVGRKRIIRKKIKFGKSKSPSGTIVSEGDRKDDQAFSVYFIVWQRLQSEIQFMIMYFLLSTEMKED